MDLRLYYQKIRDLEAKIAEEFPIIVSHETSNGGVPGAHTEVRKSLAAKMIVEGLARLATPAEAQAFRDLQAEAKQAVDQMIAAAKVQVAVVAASELERLRSAAKPKA
jgi:hypothetical protein